MEILYKFNEFTIEEKLKVFNKIKMFIYIVFKHKMYNINIGAYKLYKKWFIVFKILSCTTHLNNYITILLLLFGYLLLN